MVGERTGSRTATTGHAWNVLARMDASTKTRHNIQTHAQGLMEHSICATVLSIYLSIKNSFLGRMCGCANAILLLLLQLVNFS